MSLEKRFQKQINLKEIGREGQEKIKNSKVLVIGAGGLGCPVLTSLSMMGVEELGICDHDEVELSNLHRQPLFSEDDIGLKKADIAKRKILKKRPECHISTWLMKVSSKNAEILIKKYDVIVDCTDNLKTKFLIHDVSFLLKKQLVQASIYQYEGHLHTFNFSLNDSTGCMRCLWPKTPDDSGIQNCNEAGVLGGLPFVFGSLQAIEAIKLITGLETLKCTETLTFDLLTLETFKHIWSVDDSCPLCSSHASIHEINSTYDEQKEPFEISMEEINDLQDFVWVDLRDKDESEKMSFDDRAKYIVFCQKGIRSKRKVRELLDEGRTDIYSLYKGIDG